MPCEYVMKLKSTEYGFCYTFDGRDKNLTFNAHTTGSKAGVQFMLMLNQSNYYIADEDTAGFKVRIQLNDIAFYSSRLVVTELFETITKAMHKAYILYCRSLVKIKFYKPHVYIFLL